MKPISKSWMIPIDITTKCGHRCASCTRGVRYIRHKDMPLDQVCTEIDRLQAQGWPGGIGLIGGEPTMHNFFYDICIHLRRTFPKWKCVLFTSGGREYKYHLDEINATFGAINYNDHSVPSMHQPMFVAASDILDDQIAIETAIDRCWIQHQWCPSVNENGAYFCEVASTFARMLGDQSGYNTAYPWWRKTPDEFRDQRNRYCRLCGIPHKIRSVLDRGVDIVSPWWLRTCPTAFAGKNIIPITKQSYRANLAIRWTPERYAPVGKSHWVKRSWRLYLRMKWLSFPYWVLRKFIWR